MPFFPKRPTILKVRHIIVCFNFGWISWPHNVMTSLICLRMSIGELKYLNNQTKQALNSNCNGMYLTLWMITYKNRLQCVVFITTIHVLHRSLHHSIIHTSRCHLICTLFRITLIVIYVFVTCYINCSFRKAVDEPEMNLVVYVLPVGNVLILVLF